MNDLSRYLNLLRNYLEIRIDEESEWIKWEFDNLLHEKHWAQGKTTVCDIHQTTGIP